MDIYQTRIYRLLRDILKSGKKVDDIDIFYIQGMNR